MMREEDNQDLASKFMNFVIMQYKILYGDSIEYWFEKEGKMLFFKWAKEQGLEFTDDDFYKKFEWMNERK